MSSVVERVRGVVMVIVEAFLDEVAQLESDYGLLEDDDVTKEFKAFVADEGEAADK